MDKVEQRTLVTIVELRGCTSPRGPYTQECDFIRVAWFGGNDTPCLIASGSRRWGQGSDYVYEHSICSPEQIEQGGDFHSAFNVNTYYHPNLDDLMAEVAIVEGSLEWEIYHSDRWVECLLPVQEYWNLD
jgi:hypothetical protein